MKKYVSYTENHLEPSQDCERRGDDARAHRQSPHVRRTAAHARRVQANRRAPREIRERNESSGDAVELGQSGVNQVFVHSHLWSHLCDVLRDLGGEKVHLSRGQILHRASVALRLADWHTTHAPESQSSSDARERRHRLHAPTHRRTVHRGATD